MRATARLVSVILLLGAETNGEERRGASMQKNKAEDESVAVDLRIVLATVLAFALRTWDIGYPPVVV